MFKVELYGRVRRAVLVEGRSQRAVAREFGIARKTIQKMLRYSVPPGYQRQQAVKRPKLGPWLGVIDAILEEDKARPAKQRHTATRIFERLKAEHGFSGCYTIVKDYVHAAELRLRETNGDEDAPYRDCRRYHCAAVNLGFSRAAVPVCRLEPTPKAHPHRPILQPRRTAWGRTERSQAHPGSERSTEPG